MGADMLLAALPAANLTGRRRSKLRRLVDRLPEEVLRNWMDCFCPDAEDVVDARESLHWHVDALAQFHERREVVALHLSDWPYPLWFTGGMTWGDSPTEAYDTFAALGSVSPIYDQLRAWALDDTVKRKSSTPGTRPAAEATAIDILREFVQDICNVYGRNDDKPDALDEERLDWPDLAETYRKARALLRQHTPHPTKENDH